MVSLICLSIEYTSCSDIASLQLQTTTLNLAFDLYWGMNVLLNVHRQKAYSAGFDRDGKNLFLMRIRTNT